MMWYYGGWGWLWMTIVMPVFWGGVMALAVWAIRAFAGPSRAISPDEFEKTKKMIEG